MSEEPRAATSTHHPLIIPPADPNIAIWRYMSLKKFEWLARRRQLYMANILSMRDDPFEGSTPAAELAYWQHAADSAATEEERQSIRETRRRLSGIQQMFSGSCYVSCWHMNEHESALMWLAYAKDRESVAIRSTYQRIRDVLPPHVEIGMVRYIDYRKERFRRTNMYEAIIHKRHFYAPERELRAITVAVSDKTPWEAEVLANVVDGGYAPRVELARLVDAIYVHPEASTAFYEQVRKLCVEASLAEPLVSGMSGTPTY